MAAEKKSYKEEMADLERRRIRGVQRVLDGVSQAEVAREFSVTEGAVSHWMKKHRGKGWDGLKAKPRPGRPIIFEGEHRKKLFEIRTQVRQNLRNLADWQVLRWPCMHRKELKTGEIAM